MPGTSTGINRQKNVDDLDKSNHPHYLLIEMIYVFMSLRSVLHNTLGDSNQLLPLVAIILWGRNGNVKNTAIL